MKSKKQKRIKFKSKKIKIKVKEKKKIILKPWGGHLPNPPKNCLKRKFSFINEGIRWIDLNICLNCEEYLQNKKGCERRIEHLTKLKNKEK